MLKIGDKIKSLRKAQDITQEKLAAYLNISYQAVSKWENGTALPDITLVPQIANFFGVSEIVETPRNFPVSWRDIVYNDGMYYRFTKDETNKVIITEKCDTLVGKEYEKIYSENNRLGKMFDNIVLSREVLTKYPRNYQWMLNLSYPLIQYNDTEEHNKYSSEHGFVEEAISICERILEDCTIDSIRHSAIQILCYSYRDVGKEDLALKLANEMPDMFLCKEHLLSHIYTGEEQIEQCQRLLLSMVDSSSGIICMLTSDGLMGKELSVLQKIELIETANILYKLILGKDDDSLFFNCRLCGNYSLLAELWCQNGSAEKAMENLLLAEIAATNYDACNALTIQKYKSTLLNRCTFDPKATGKNWEGTETGALLDTLQRSVFDCLRESDDFQQLIIRLNSIQ